MAGMVWKRRQAEVRPGVTDLNMPRMDGIEMIAAVRKVAATLSHRF